MEPYVAFVSEYVVFMLVIEFVEQFFAAVEQLFAAVFEWVAGLVNEFVAGLVIEFASAFA